MIFVHGIKGFQCNSPQNFHPTLWKKCFLVYEVLWDLNLGLYTFLFLSSALLFSIPLGEILAWGGKWVLDIFPNWKVCCLGRYSIFINIIRPFSRTQNPGVIEQKHSNSSILLFCHILADILTPDLPLPEKKKSGIFRFDLSFFSRTQRKLHFFVRIMM